VRAIITPPSTASTAPLRLVPAPRGMIGSFSRLQSFTTATTSSVVRGKTTAVGKFFSNVYASHSYTSNSSSADNTASAPTMACSSRMRFVWPIAGRTVPKSFTCVEAGGYGARA